MQLENVRRKHNYLPLIMEVLKILAKRGELVGLMEKVRKAGGREGGAAFDCVCNDPRQRRRKLKIKHKKLRKRMSNKLNIIDFNILFTAHVRKVQ